MIGRITTPHDGARVKSKVRVQGTVTGQNTSRCLWIAHRRVSEGPFWPKEPRVTLREDGSFSVTAIEGGAPGPIVISLLLVDKETDGRFLQWFIDCHGSADYPSLMPSDFRIEELHSIAVEYDPTAPARLFISYSHKDETFLNDLEESLAVLKRSGAIEIWHDRRIVAGAPISTEIEQEIQRADIMVLLISPSFIASDYCYGKEMRMALKRNQEGDLRVVPVIIRPTDWQSSPIRDLSALPRDGKAISTWANPGEAWLDVAKEFRRLVKDVRGTA